MIADIPTRILLVDDQPANLAALATVLAELGAELVTADSGQAALRALLAHEFALVLLDVRMPAMDGFETARLIREHPRTAGVPIIFMTAGQCEAPQLEQAYALGAADCLVKPFNAQVLRAKVTVFVELYRKTAELARLEAERHRHATEALARSEQQLGESMERFALLLESSGEGILGLDMGGKCTFVNAAAAAMLHDRPAELLGTAIHARIHHHHEDGRPYPVEECTILRAAAEGRVLRAEDLFWTSDGNPLPVAFSVHPMVVGGRAAGAVLTFTDITGRRHAEAEREHLYRELRAANDRMIEIFYRAPAFMAVMRGPEHVFEMVNERFLALIGTREVIGRPMREVLPEVEGQGFFELLDGVYRSGEPYEGSNVRMLLQPGARQDGMVEHFVDFVYMALRDPDGS
ncbi:MAG TPA: response regulator, partial [Ramlibacter sp.]